MSIDFTIDDLHQIGKYLNIPRGDNDSEHWQKVTQALIEKMKTPGDEFFGCCTPMAIKMRFEQLRNK